MGRGIATGPVPPEIVQQHFALRQDGQIVRRGHRIAALAHEPAAFAGPKGVALVRMTYNGKIRRLSAARVAYAITKGHWPTGLLAKPSHRPNGKASSLARRVEADMTLIKAMSEAPDASIAKLSALTGSPESCVSARLGRIAERGLAASPMCVPGRSWCLTGAGKALAMNGQLLIDDTGRDILTIMARAPVRQLELARRLGGCNLTAKRRLGMLVGQGLIDVNASRFRITDQGRSLLGDQCPKPWVTPAAISAAAASDVQRRIQYPNEMSAAERTRISSLSASKARATAKRNGNAAFNHLGMTG
jgi:hypothetical protein